jgi:hypothetical protein
MKATLIIAGEIRLKGEREPVCGCLFEVDRNDPEAVDLFKRFVRENFYVRVSLSAEKLPCDPGQESSQGRFA